MENLKSRIMNVLNQNGIHYTYDCEEKLIYIHRHSEYGEVYSIFNRGKDLISNNCIYANPIPDNLIKSMQSYLDYINRHIVQGFLYIDYTTSCIAFCIDYQISVLEQEQEDSDAFKLFCIQSYRVFTLYQKELYDFIIYRGDNIKPRGIS